VWHIPLGSTQSSKEMKRVFPSVPILSCLFGNIFALIALGNIRDVSELKRLAGVGTQL
jgi:hypothetical protein